MDAEDVCLLLNFLEGDLFYSSATKSASVLIISQYPDVKSLKSLCKCFAHIPKAKDANRLAGQLFPAVQLPFPYFLPNLSIRPGNVVEKCQQHPQSMFCHCIPIALGGVV